MPIQVLVQYPKTEEGRQKLAQKAANVHTDIVNQSIQSLNCPSRQKRLLLDAVLKNAGGQTKE